MPSPDVDSSEFIDLKTLNTSSFLLAFSLTPYQAFFQAETPSFAPRRSQIVVYSPETAVADIDADIAVPIFTSGQFSVGNNFREQLCVLEHPVFTPPGSMVRVQLIGRQQRQVSRL